MWVGTNWRYLQLFYHNFINSTKYTEKEVTHFERVEAGNVLHAVLKVVSSIGGLALVFGQSYAGIALLIYGGENLVSRGLPETTEMAFRCHTFTGP